MINLPGEITLVGTPYGNAPNAPKIDALSQYGGALVARVRPSDVGPFPTTSMKLYRGLTPQGPFSAIEAHAMPDLFVVSDLIDAGPIFGVEAFYIATAIAANGSESAGSNVAPFAAVRP